MFTGKKVRGDVAMTGEITLRGKVLPIGGLKEKSLAARRVGINTVIIPQGNARDVEELPAVIRDELHFIPVKRVDEVFDVMFNEPSDKQEITPDFTSREPDAVRCNPIA